MLHSAPSSEALADSIFQAAKKEDIFEIASQFPDPVVQQYAKELQAAGVTRASFLRDSITDELIASGILPIPAADIVEAFRRHYRPGPVGVYWDIENMGLPNEVTALEAVTSLREKIMATFGNILEFKAYMDLEMYAKLYDSFTRVVLADSGLQIVDAAHGGASMRRKEVADKQIIVDALWFALTHEQPTICIISGDSDFSPLLAKLKMTGIRTVVVTTSENVRSLREQASFALRWPTDFIPNCKPMKMAPQRNSGNAPTSSHLHVPDMDHTESVSPSRRRATESPATTSLVVPDSLGTSPPNNNGSGSLGRSPEMRPKAGGHASPFSLLLSDDDRAKFSDLLECITRAQGELGARKVRRSKVGQYFKELNPLASYKELVDEGLEKGIIKIGGRMGNAWIALGTDSVNLSDEETSSALSIPTNVKSNDPNDKFSQWYITLRYSRRFKEAFDELDSFTDTRVSFLKKERENDFFYRMGIGTFDSRDKAERYFQRHFGHLNVLPKFTHEPLLKAFK